MRIYYFLPQQIDLLQKLTLRRWYHLFHKVLAIDGNGLGLYLE